MIRTSASGHRLRRFASRAALATGLAGAAFVAAQALAGAQAPPAPTVEVLVTARAIAAGATLQPADLRWQAWPADAVARDWLVRGKDTPGLAGQVVPAALVAGMPVNAALALPVAGSGFAAAIRPGWRAVSIAVTPAAGLAGFVAPGDRVDVILTQTLGNRRTAQTLLADLGVLGVDQQSRGGGSASAAAGDAVADAAAALGGAPPGLITLEVLPAQAEALAVAAEIGKISLVLRGPAAGGVAPATRRWDTDVTGLPAALLIADNGGGSVPVAVANASPTPVAASPPARTGTEIVYGAEAPASPTAPGPAK